MLTAPCTWLSASRFGSSRSLLAQPTCTGAHAWHSAVLLSKRQHGSGSAIRCVSDKPLLVTKPKLSLRQKLGQSFNPAGISMFTQLLLGCVFDKDGTLTWPYSMEIHPDLLASLDECTRVFDGRLVLFSNSAGLQQFDPKGAQAGALEAALKLPVLRHTEKKPAGSAADLEGHFGCKAHKLLMVGDRYLTDVLYGNRNGMLTVKVSSLPGSPRMSAKEPKTVRLARRIEGFYINRWRRKGIHAPLHPLVPSPTALLQFIKQGTVV